LRTPDLKTTTTLLLADFFYWVCPKHCKSQQKSEVWVAMTKSKRVLIKGIHGYIAQQLEVPFLVAGLLVHVHMEKILSLIWLKMWTTRTK